MAVNEIGNVSEIENWQSTEQSSFPARMWSGLTKFARKKPLGFVCGVIVIIFFIIGDAIPATANKIADTTGLGDEPVPYIADQLDHELGFIYPYAKQDLRARLQGSSGDHLLGTDAIGRDILSRLLYGSRTAVVVAFGAVFIQQLLGGSIGIAAGYYGGWVDKALYRVVDVFQALPGLVVLITILGVFGSGLWQLVFVIGALFGPTNSRVIRGQALYCMASPFVEGAKVVGAGDMRIMRYYVFPNVFALIVLGATLSLGFVVLLEATLSFLGYGLPPPFPSWGQMLSLEGRQYMRTQPGLAIYPGVAIGILVFSFNLFGDALRDALDPRLRGR
jgi:peptide/nickel transport system permease protein